MSADLLSMEKLNALPAPLMIRDFKSSPWFELIDICVETGLHRINVCGMTERRVLSSCAQILDDSGNIYDVEVFFTDYEDN